MALADENWEWSGVKTSSSKGHVWFNLMSAEGKPASLRRKQTERTLNSEGCDTRLIPKVFQIG